ncbi:carbon-nitrogen hydrolase family protein [Candidatus Woesearchaeota archaeon]|nr:carbon-nitrogen hydrolase family protein [Candidatus Woesearchaeota archaeon]
MKVKIAVVQMEIAQYAPEKNLARAEDYIKKASARNANIIVFPEDFITGPFEDGIHEKYADKEKRYARHFQRLAKKYKIDIVPGSIIEKEKSKFYNTTCYINAKGRILASYRKMNLWSEEKKNITPGKNITMCKTRYGRIGLMICWDMMFPEMFRKMMKKDVNIVFCPTFWVYGDAGRKGLQHDKNSDIKLVDAVSTCRAFENEIIFVCCNAAGRLRWNKYQDTLLGHSQITVPFKGAIKKSDHHREEMFIQEVDTSLLRDAEKVYQIKKDIKKIKKSTL